MGLLGPPRRLSQVHRGKRFLNLKFFVGTGCSRNPAGSRIGLRNYWGYNSIGYLAPHNEYSSRGQRGQQVQEFKQMVKTLHEAGIEVILDVVYNHTAEGNHLGPMLSFKGIDNAAYYRLVAGDLRYYMDYTGTGNSLNMRHPHVLQFIMDSLRYWVLETHVDGFRFDLAATLARELHDVDRLSAFFDLIQQDPVVSQVKLIAWFIPDGNEMAEEHWGEGFAKSIGVFLNGEAIPTPTDRGERIVDDSFYLLFNAHHESIAFKLPEAKWGQKWTKVFATHELKFAEEEQSFAAGNEVAVEARSLMVLRRSG